MNIIISKTGEAHGFGCDFHKWVSFLTDAERQHVRDNTAIVLVETGKWSDGARETGTTLRRVHGGNGGYYHRVPSDEVLNAVVAMWEAERKGTL